jgi:hypothetical protein
MSKRINVNPDHYKTAGRDRPAVVASARQERAEVRAARTGSASRRPNPIAAARQERAESAAARSERSSGGSGGKRQPVAPRAGKKKTAGAPTKR